MAISNDSLEKLLPLLRPYLRDENERRAYLIVTIKVIPVVESTDWRFPSPDGEEVSVTPQFETFTLYGF